MSNSRGRRGRTSLQSVVWDYFTDVSKTTGKCKSVGCLKDVTRNGGTSNLWAHLKVRHPILFFEAKEKEKRVSEIEGNDAGEHQNSGRPTSTEAAEEDECETQEIDRPPNPTMLPLSVEVAEDDLSEFQASPTPSTSSSTSSNM